MSVGLPHPPSYRVSVFDVAALLSPRDYRFPTRAIQWLAVGFLPRSSRVLSLTSTSSMRIRLRGNQGPISQVKDSLFLTPPVCFFRVSAIRVLGRHQYEAHRVPRFHARFFLFSPVPTDYNASPYMFNSFPFLTSPQASDIILTAIFLYLPVVFFAHLFPPFLVSPVLLASLFSFCTGKARVRL